MSGGKGGSPTPPAPPDPTQVAQAQSQASIDAARAQQGLNAVNQSNPWGSVNYQIDPTTGRLTQNTALNPALQQQLNNQQQGGAAMSGMGLFGLGSTANTLAKPVDLGQFDNLTSHVNGGKIQSSIGSYGKPQTNVANNAGQYQTSLAKIDPAHAFNWNMSGMPDLNQDWGAQVDKAQQTVIDAELPILQRLQQQQQSGLDAKLAGQGFTQGSVGADRQQQNLAQSQGEAYNQLAAQAYQQGLQTQGQLFGENLASRGQLFGEQSTQAQNQLQAQGQQFGENLAGSQFHNQALQGQFGQNLAARQFGNAAQQQAYQQALGAGLYGLQAQNQQFGQGMQNAGLGNQVNQQEMQNYLTSRQYPIQEAGQLLGFGGGVQTPQFGQVPQAGIQAPNIGQYYYNNLAAQQDAYNQQVAASNNAQSGKFGLGSSVVGAIPWGSMMGG